MIMATMRTKVKLATKHVSEIRVPLIEWAPFTHGIAGKSGANVRQPVCKSKSESVLSGTRNQTVPKI